MEIEKLATIILLIHLISGAIWWKKFVLDFHKNRPDDLWENVSILVAIAGGIFLLSYSIYFSHGTKSKDSTRD